MYNKELLNAKNKLNPIDNEYQTYGCRHTNPDICSNNGLPNVCAFVSEDCICKRPPKSWKKLLETLKNERTENK